jgi:hypothetical protein
MRRRRQIGLAPGTAVATGGDGSARVSASAGAVGGDRSIISRDAA